MIWELGSRERMANRSFKIWDLGQCSVGLQVPVKLVDCIHNVFIMYGWFISLKVTNLLSE